MRIWLLSHLTESIGTRITRDLMESAGHEVVHVQPHQLHLAAGQGGAGGEASLALVGAPELPDLVFTRLGSSAPPQSLDVVRHLEAMGLRVVNSARSLERCRDKFRSYQIMARHGVSVPPATLVGPDGDIDQLVAHLGQPPYIVKLPVGTKGGGVTIVDTQRSLRSTLDVLLGLGERVLVQKFIAEAAGTDVRITVLDGEARFAVRRTAAGDEFRSNIHLGGQDTHEELDPRHKDVAERAARAHGLAFAGVDILESDAGPTVAEVNGSPGLSGIFRQHGEAFRQAYHAFLERVGARPARAETTTD